MKLPSPMRPIMWHQGLFLQPQHLQYQDKLAQSHTSPLQQYQTPYFWGFKDILLQDSALKNREIDLVRGEMIFQDGSWIKISENAEIRPRSFADISFSDGEQSSVTVYIGLRKWQAHSPNTSVYPSSMPSNLPDSRFISIEDPESAGDMYQDGPEADIRFMRHVLHIFWDHELPDLQDFWVMPVAKIGIDGESAHLERDFFYPTFTLMGSESIVTVLKNIREQLVSRTRVFETFKLTQGFQSSDFEAHFLPHLLALGVLNRALPKLHHHLEYPIVHPWYIYGVIREIVGELSTFTDRIDALGQLKDGRDMLPPYDHENLGGCFSEAQLLIGELLDAIAVGGENIYHLIRDDSFFRTEFPADQFSEYSMFFLVVKTKAEEDFVISEIQNMAKLGSEDDIDILVSRSLPGVSIRHRLVPPPGLPKKAETHYFKISHQESGWEAIKTAKSICLHWDDASDDTEIELVVTRT